MAEAITLTGQALIKKSMHETNKYVNTLLQNETHKDYATYADTDSIVGESLIYVNDSLQTIEEFYETSIGAERCIGIDNYVKDVSKYTTKSVIEDDIQTVSILRVMKHKVRKRMFRLTIDDKSITITEDHSVIIIRDGTMVSIKPGEMITTDRVITIV